jgi:nucleoside phosphorylase
MDIPTTPPRSNRDYTVACICPMELELAPVQAMLDEVHADLPTRRDQNSYVLGRMGEHNVVVAVMPEIGNNSAARVATQLLNDFPAVRFGLLVGIGGGVPGEGGEDDIRLGDIVVTFGGVVQYDMGKVTTGGVLERTGKLGKPPVILQTSIERLKGQQRARGSRIGHYLEEMVEKFPLLAKTCTYPGMAQDRLFKAKYSHQGGQDCVDCDTTQLVEREARQEDSPKIHYGTMGSANVVIKDSGTREQLKRDLQIACVEMEAAGLMDTFPYLVIRGICDYADSHKNNQWQGYAAAVAAAYTKELLAVIPPMEAGLTLVDVVDVSQVSHVINDTNTKLKTISEAIQMDQNSKLMDWLSSVNFWGKQLDFCKRAQEGTGRWILDDQKFKAWLAGRHNTLWCEGHPGTGKTILSAIIVDYLSKTLENKRCGLAWVYVDYREHDLQTMESLFTNLLVQLFKQQGEISKSMSKFLGVNWKEAKPSPSDYKTWLQEEIQKFDQTILIIDALDELCTTDLCRRFIKELQGLKPAVHLLVTSRPYPEIRGLLGDGLKIEIRPRKEDVMLYIQSRLNSSDRLRGHMKADPSLSDLVITPLTEANDRM